MPPLQKTPVKADAGIENIKRSLSAKWGIQWPTRDSTWSPSKRDPNRVEDKIVTFIQFLYFRKPPQEGALDHALKHFEENAPQIISKWPFKPRGEPDVLPFLEASNSALKQDFLKKRPVLSEKEITELTESLAHHLNSTITQVKAGEKFPKTVKIEGENSRFCFQLRSTDTVSDNPIPTKEASPTKPNRTKRQSSLALWLRSKSEPGPAKGGFSPARHPPSSDDYADNEIAELLVHADAMNTSSAHPIRATYARNTGGSAELKQSSSSEDDFETPPSSPPLRQTSSSGSSADKKRKHPNSMQAPPLRNVSRKTSSEKSAQEVSDPKLIKSSELV